MRAVLVPPKAARQTSTMVTTSLYELIEVLQDTAGPEGDTLVVATMMHLLESGRITFPHRLGTNQCN